MKRFARLYAAMDSTTKTNAKVQAMADYFTEAPPEDAAWALFFLAGGKLRAPFPSRLMRTWASGDAEIPEWLFDACYDAVGDLAETAALLLGPSPEPVDWPLHRWVERRLIPLRGMPENEQHEMMRLAWSALTPQERFVWNKIITGEFRVGASKTLVIRGLAKATGLPAEVLAHRLMGAWQPTADAYLNLVSGEAGDAAVSRPYPFYLAYPLEKELSELGNVTNWLVEWKWDGIRAQLVRRHGGVYIWSRGGELITERFPELEAIGARLPDGTVIDGELLAWRDGRPLPFGDLQHRITRKKLARSILENAPAILLAFDLLEYGGEDLRTRPLSERRALLESLPVQISPAIVAESWPAIAVMREQSRDNGAEGLMLKRLDSPYGVGREKGFWWKWKVNPLHVDAVLIYAQRGNGRRASLYTDYTFGVWDRGELVPFAKAYSGLTDEEIRKVDSFVRRNTTAKYGPVREVKPELVFEIAFEGIQKSARHKAGVAVRFPRMARWRTDKRAEDADSLETVMGILAAQG